MEHEKTVEKIAGGRISELRFSSDAARRVSLDA
jgi:hypothetical protein